MRAVFILVVVVYLATRMTGTSAAPTELDPQNPPVLEPGEQCQSVIVNAAMPIWPKNALRDGTVGWSIVRYDLDGGGRAQNREVVSSAPEYVFDKASLDSIARSKFINGFIKQGCKAIFVYSQKASN